jgi:glutathione synthase/RimK-type ligase-like ATP-grasp enzyme
LGVPLPTTIWIDPGETPDLGALLADHGWHRGFLKPVVGANAIRTLRFTAQEAASAQTFLAEALRFGPMMVQPYLDKVETSGEFSGIWINGRYAHGVQKIPLPGDWRVQDDHGASDRPYSLTPDELSLGENILSLTHTLCPTQQPLLYARVDFLRDELGNPKLMELELVEPSLFFRHGAPTARLLANALMARLRS